MHLCFNLSAVHGVLDQAISPASNRLGSLGSRVADDLSSLNWRLKPRVNVGWGLSDIFERARCSVGLGFLGQHFFHAALALIQGDQEGLDDVNRKFCKN